MSTHHDEDMLDEDDVRKAKRGLIRPHAGQTRITLWVDTDIYEAYLAYAERVCRDVTPEMNAALRQYRETLPAEDNGPHP